MCILEGRGFGEAPSCTSTNCSAVSVDRFEKQPADLQRVLDKSFSDHGKDVRTIVVVFGWGNAATHKNQAFLKTTKDA